MHIGLRRSHLGKLGKMLGGLALSLAVFPSLVLAQAGKLSKQNVVDLLTGDVSSDRVAAIAKDKGISFEMTAAAEKDIRGAGGSDQLVQVLKELAPAPAAPTRPTRATPAASPPVMLIQSIPGQGHVYVDDEPVGSTSREGRMKLTRFAAGDHNVRVTLDGYQDYEQSVTLAEGQTATVTATLQPVEAPPVSNPVQPTRGTENTPSGTGQAGYLGILPMEQQPAGARGVVISGAEPGGPADVAGIKTYDTVLAVGGRAVRTPQDLLAAVGAHRAGEVIPVTWFNGSTNVTRQIRLGARPQQTEESAAPQNPIYTPPPAPTQRPMQRGVASFPVAHDHGQNGQNYCVGVMTIGNGMIVFRAANGQHNYEFPYSTVKEAKKNAVYLMAMGAFHIKLAKGTNYNFVALNSYGRPEPPDTLLIAIDQATGK